MILVSHPHELETSPPAGSRGQVMASLPGFWVKCISRQCNKIVRKEEKPVSWNLGIIFILLG